MIPAQYRPRHVSGCACVVCWTNLFHREMTLRNDARAERCRLVLQNPQLAEPAQTNLFSVLDEVTQ